VIGAEAAAVRVTLEVGPAETTFRRVMVYSDSFALANGALQAR
jgi:hypothetical protein